MEWMPWGQKISLQDSCIWVFLVWRLMMGPEDACKTWTWTSDMNIEHHTWTSYTHTHIIHEHRTSDMNIEHHTWTCASDMNIEHQTWTSNIEHRHCMYAHQTWTSNIRHERRTSDKCACMSVLNNAGSCMQGACTLMHACMHAQAWVHAHPWVKWTLPMHALLCVQTPWTNSWVYHGTVVTVIWISNHMAYMLEMEVHVANDENDENMLLQFTVQYVKQIRTGSWNKNRWTSGYVCMHVCMCVYI